MSLFYQRRFEMKTRKSLITAVFIAIFALVSIASAADTDNGITRDQRKKAIKGYRYSIHNENTGVRLSTIGHIQRYHLNELTPELKNILNNDPVEDVRIAAAMALNDISGKEGRKAVEKSSASNSSARTARFCQFLVESTYAGIYEVH
jgi:hypothetical protein